MKKSYEIIFSVIMWILIILSVAVTVIGFAANWLPDGKEANSFNEVATAFRNMGTTPTDVVFFWTYIMLAILLFVVVVVGLIVSCTNDVVNLVKPLPAIAVFVLLCAAAYYFAPGTPAEGLSVAQPSDGMLKLTDTIIFATYITGALAILAIIFNFVVSLFRK